MSKIYEYLRSLETHPDKLLLTSFVLYTHIIKNPNIVAREELDYAREISNRFNGRFGIYYLEKTIELMEKNLTYLEIKDPGYD